MLREEKKWSLYIKQYPSSQCQQTVIRSGKQACELLRLGELTIQKQIFFNEINIHPYDAFKTVMLQVKTSDKSQFPTVGLICFKADAAKLKNK